MTEIAPHWFLDLDVGPEWLFFRLRKSGPDTDPSPPLAEQVWGIAEGQRIYRVVLELDPDVLLSSYLVGQLVRIHKRCHQAGGLARICGFRPEAYDVLQVMCLAERFPNYRTRQDAVMGSRPAGN